MSSNDYYDHITRLVRTPSAVTTDVPRYGNAPMFFRRTMFSAREAEAEAKDDHNKSHKKNHQQSLQFKEDVEVFEYEQSSSGDDNKANGNSVNGQVSDGESVDADANRFIQQKRKGFELCKWKTFKAP